MKSLVKIDLAYTCHNIDTKMTLQLRANYHTFETTFVENLK